VLDADGELVPTDAEAAGVVDERDADNNGVDDKDNMTVVLPSKLHKALGKPTAMLLESYLTEVREMLAERSHTTLRKCLSMGTAEAPSSFRQLLLREVGSVGVREVGRHHPEITEAFAKAVRSLFD
jgi:hypothetical protein